MKRWAMVHLSLVLETVCSSLTSDGETLPGLDILLLGDGQPHEVRVLVG